MNRAIDWLITVFVILALAAVAASLGACSAPQKPSPAPWPSKLTFAVVYRCIEGGYRFPECACYADRMWEASPKPDEMATDGQKRAAMKACGMEEKRAEPEPLNSEAM